MLKHDKYQTLVDFELKKFQIINGYVTFAGEFTSAWCSINKVVISVCPSWAAKCKGVNPAYTITKII